MNKTAIKNFAIWARNKLISDIETKAGLVGITEHGIALPLPQSTGNVQFFDIGTKDYAAVRGEEIRQRDALVNAINAKRKDCAYAEAFHFVVEKAAYTWFNRLIAIRFMEVNDYLPSRVRVLSSENPGKAEPDMVTRPWDTDLDFTEREHDHIGTLQDENQLDELFRFLFNKQCRKLHEVLPELFDDDQSVNSPDSYLDFLLTLSFTDQDGVLWHLVHDIPEKDFRIRTPEDDERQKLENIPEEEMPAGQVEIIGWLYQYYNTEPKDRVFANLKKNIKISKDDIPAATQLFTPDWIVRYMVENSLGRLWIEHLKAVEESGTLDLSAYGIKAHTEGTGLVIDEGPIEISEETLQINSDYEIKKNWKYYLEEAKQEPDVQAQLRQIRKEYVDLRPEDIKVIDPCMGSGHILVRLFDVLMQIYDSQGWTARDAARSIVDNNLYGLDIDDRAAQLAYFAVMMKARQYDRRFLEQGIRPHVYGIQESNHINRSHLDYLGSSLSDLERNNAVNQMNSLLDEFMDAKEYGSILQPKAYDWALLERFVEDSMLSKQVSWGETGLDVTQTELRTMITQGQVLAQKYHSTVTNPPYMGSSGMSEKLSRYVKNEYPDDKNDLFAVLIERCNNMVISNGYNCMVTMQTWMFLSSFEKMRLRILNEKQISVLLHMENMVMHIAFGTSVTVIQNTHIKKFRGTYTHIKMSNITCEGNEQPFSFPVPGNRFAQISSERFFKIPGAPIAYWISNAFLQDFVIGKKISNLAETRKGLTTAKDDVFLRMWFEVSILRISLYNSENNPKWYPLNKGGDFRRWYGNQEYIINWENNGEKIKSFTPAVIRNEEYYFRESITWNDITNGLVSLRYKAPGQLFNDAGPSIFGDNRILMWLLGLGNTKVMQEICYLIAPTIHFTVGQMSEVPVLQSKEAFDSVVQLVDKCIKMSRIDWDSFETSWDFQRHPLLPAREKPELAMAGEQAPDIDEKQMEFAIFCVENLAEDLGQDATEVFDLLTKESDLLYSYIIPCYEPLHSQDKAYIMDDIKGVMRERGLLP